MSGKLPQALLIAALITHCAFAHADCAGASVREVRQAYAQAQVLETRHDPRGALSAYAAAQAYTCDANPVAADAARRAASLALPLAQAAQKAGQLDRAAELYELGGHYAAADRALVMALRSHADEPAAVGRVIAHFADRAEPSFIANHRGQLEVTGAYVLDARLRAEVLAMPATGVARALQREATDFNEAYLADIVKAVQSLPDDPTDLVAVQAATQRQQAFQRRWPLDLLKASREELERVRQWAAVTPDAAARRSFEQQRVQRAEQRASTLLQRYREAPSLLAAAIDYQRSITNDQDSFVTRTAPVRTLAARLGDAASAANRLTLAASYYDVAGDNAKAATTRERQRKLALDKLRPAIDQAQREAEALRRTFGDPRQAETMRQQATAVREALQ
jgi:hypothetical protein